MAQVGFKDARDLLSVWCVLLNPDRAGTGMTVAPVDHVVGGAVSVQASAGLATASSLAQLLGVVCLGNLGGCDGLLVLVVVLMIHLWKDERANLIAAPVGEPVACLVDWLKGEPRG